jgi:hypothetical protein
MATGSCSRFLSVGGDRWGIVGFDECHRDRSWSDEEPAAPRTAVSMIGVGI